MKKQLKDKTKDKRKRCKLCGRYFTPKSRWNWFCPACRKRAAHVEVMEYNIPVGLGF